MPLRGIGLGLLLATAFARAGAEPATGPDGQPAGATGRVAAVADAEPGAWRDFKADFLQGMYAAEEEVAAGKPTWWRVESRGAAPAADERTGLPVRAVDWPAGDVIEQLHVLARVRGHNRAMNEYLELKAAGAAPAAFEATDPTRDEIAAEERAARLDARARATGSGQGSSP